MKDKKKGIFYYVWRTVLRSLLSMVMCAFLFLSMSVLTLGVLGQNIGYRITEQNDKGEIVIVEEHFYELGEAEVKSLELPEGQQFEQIREVSSGVQVAADVVTQLLMVFIVAAFPYSMMWDAGDKDSTSIRYRGMKYDPLKGLKIGLLSMIPYVLLYILLWLSKFGILSGNYFAIYRLINISFLPYINWIVSPSITVAAGISAGRLLALISTLLVIPVTCCIAYLLGTKQISVHEHVTYTGVNKGNADTEI